MTTAIAAATGEGDAELSCVELLAELEAAGQRVVVAREAVCVCTRTVGEGAEAGGGAADAGAAGRWELCAAGGERRQHARRRVHGV